MKTISVVALVAVLGCGSSHEDPDDQTQTDSQLNAVMCAGSVWSGDIEHSGSVLRVKACVGDECSEEFDVAVHSGSSCLVPASEGPAEPGTTPRPEGQLLDDLTVYASSSGEEVRFATCALRDGDASSDIFLKVSISFGTESAWAVGETASLQVRGDDTPYLVEATTEVGPIPMGGAETCAPGFEIEF